MSAPADKASAGAAAANGQVRDDRGEQAADIPARYASGEHLRIKAGFGAPILLSWFLGCDSAAHSAIVAWYVENVRLGAELLCDPDYLVLDDMLAVDLSLLPRDAEESYDLIGMTRQEVIDFAAAAPGRLDPTVVVFQAVQRAAAKRADPQPIPLIQRVEVPPFPMDALPKVYADMAATTAVSAQIDPALTGCLALGSLAVCATGTARVYIHDTWSEPVNLYLTAVADVGERKSAAKAAMFEPLYAFERELREAAGPVIARAAEERKKVERDLAAARKADSTDDPFTVAENLSRIEVPAMPQLMVGDATPEALERLLGEQNGRISVVSDEGGIFDIFAGRYSNNGEASFEVMLKGHSGDSVSVARISRPNVYIDHAAISVCVIMQPSVLSKIAAHGDFDGRGLLARVLYAVIESRAGSRAFTAPTDTAICSAHTAALHDLAAELYERDDLATLRFSAAALDRLKELHDQVEPELAAGGELTLIRGWGSKYLGAIARIAACLHLGDNGGRGSMVIPAGTVDRAIALGEYFTAHALNVLTAFGADPVALDAEYLLTRVQSLPRRLTGITAREIHQAARARFRARKDMDPALQRLVENGHLIEIGRPANTPKRGRPTSEMYRLANTAGRA